jgi:hypothetical protein
MEVIKKQHCVGCRSQWPLGLSCGSAADRLLGLRVRIPQDAWMSVSCECCVLSGRGLCVGLITRPEESYRVRCVKFSVIMNPRLWEGLGPLGLLRHGKKKVVWADTEWEVSWITSSKLKPQLFSWVRVRMSQLPEFEHTKNEQTAITSGTRFEVCFKNRTKTS